MARSLWEAETYVNLRLAETTPRPEGLVSPTPAPKVGENMTEGPDGWTWHSPIGDIAIPYVSEKTTVQVGAPFGLGRSRLIDAAEWIHVAHLYGERAIADMMEYAGDEHPKGDFQDQERRRSISLGFELAVDATLQAMAFLPDGEDVVPDGEIWSTFGAGVKDANPDVVTRAKMEEELEYWRGVNEDFIGFYEETP
ncbi:hypothetical protein ACFV9C_35350 [Kribbella sp. NPDC059898]|uniref:hypothetical protein n=1 Tax=Kribbella sp. NPDC059898 TaxID=3346995 RepID=UPI00364A39A1